MAAVPRVNLSNGLYLPAIGFGTWELSGNLAQKAVTAALSAGYRLIDTARIYGNEQAVGAALRASGVARSDVCITTKLWNDDQGYDAALAACDASLTRLGLSYVDLYLIHWPATSRRAESWRALGELQRRGRARAVGVSNYTVRHLEELMGHGIMTPAVNQVEFHPFIYEQQRELLAFCARHHIVVEAYSPLSRASHEQNPTIRAVAAQTGRSPQQVVLRWCIQHGTVPLPRSHLPAHMRANLDVFGFTLDDRAMQALDSLSDGERVTWDPATMR